MVADWFIVESVVVWVHHIVASVCVCVRIYIQFLFIVLESCCFYRNFESFFS